MAVAGWALIVIGGWAMATAPINDNERLLVSLVKVAAGLAGVLIGVSIIT